MTENPLPAGALTRRRALRALSFGGLAAGGLALGGCGSAGKLSVGSSASPPTPTVVPTSAVAASEAPSGAAPSGAVSSPPTGSTSGRTSPSVAAAPQALRSSASRGVPGPPAAAGAALQAFGAALLGQVGGQGNAVLSPYSVYAVLAMARAGAGGRTAAQLDAVLGSKAAQAGNLTAIDAAVAAAITAGHPAAGADPRQNETRPLLVQAANSAWVSPHLVVRPSYLDALARGFGVGMFSVDYAADPEAARVAINAWVATRTHRLIPQLLTRGSITGDTLLTLVNALYFSAPWSGVFMPSDSVSFRAIGGQARTVPAMQSAEPSPGSSGAGWRSVTLPYVGNGLAMTVVVPDAGGFAAIGRDLPAVLARAVPEAGRPTSVTLPTFRNEVHLELVPAMQALGVTDLFTPQADLSGISAEALMADHLIHQAVITVDEKGTEAAAATAMTMIPGSLPTSTPLVVDRPFYYSIHDTVTRAPLFLGRITDPTG